MIAHDTAFADQNTLKKYYDHYSILNGTINYVYWLGIRSFHIRFLVCSLCTR
jgi:hypothetical protein